MRHLEFLVALCVVWSPGLARAQEFPLTRTVPAPSIDGGPWLSPFSWNAPAHLVRLSGFHVMLSASEHLSEPLRPWHVSSETLWMAQSLPLVKGACFVSGTALHDADGYTGGILGAGCGWSLSRSWSMGARLLTRVAPADPSTDGARDWALGLLFAPRPGFSASYQVESLLMSPVAGLPQDRMHRLEFALGRDWRVWTGLHLAERRLDWALTGGLRFEVVRGVHLVLAAGWSQRDREAWRDGAPLELGQPEAFTVSADLAADAPVFTVYPPPDPLWKRLVREAVSDAQASALPGALAPWRGISASLLHEGPWTLWPDLVKAR